VPLVWRWTVSLLWCRTWVTSWAIRDRSYGEASLARKMWLPRVTALACRARTALSAWASWCTTTWLRSALSLASSVLLVGCGMGWPGPGWSRIDVGGGPAGAGCCGAVGCGAVGCGLVALS